MTNSTWWDIKAYGTVRRWMITISGANIFIDRPKVEEKPSVIATPTPGPACEHILELFSVFFFFSIYKSAEIN